MICIENQIVKNILVQRIQELCHREIERGVEIFKLWIPSHMGIRGNDLADQAAKNSAGYLIETGSPISREGCMSLEGELARGEATLLFVVTKDWILE